MIASRRRAGCARRIERTRPSTSVRRAHRSPGSSQANATHAQGMPESRASASRAFIHLAASPSGSNASMCQATVTGTRSGWSRSGSMRRSARSSDPFAGPRVTIRIRYLGARVVRVLRRTSGSRWRTPLALEWAPLVRWTRAPLAVSAAAVKRHRCQDATRARTIKKLGTRRHRSHSGRALADELEPVRSLSCPRVPQPHPTATSFSPAGHRLRGEACGMRIRQPRRRVPRRIGPRCPRMTTESPREGSYG
jgi:hypothetical protein